MNKSLHLSIFLLISAVGVFAQNQEGMASYYNDKYHGAKTYSGEPYDKNDFTCAHKSFPMGTNLRVTNLNNSKTVDVRVNDRESSTSRIIDVSMAAAKAIDLMKTGTARVKLEVIKEEKKATLASNELPEKPKNSPTADLAKTSTTSTPPMETTQKNGSDKSADPIVATSTQPAMFNAADYEPVVLLEISLKKPTKTGFGVQVAGLTNEASLFKMLEEMDEKSFGAVLVSVQKNDKGEPIYKVVLGHFETEKEAAKYKTSLKKDRKINGFVVDLSKLNTQK